MVLVLLKTFLEEEFGKNINVNKRHLDLLTASMTVQGKIASVSRYGIDRKQVGPLAKICFEQPFDNVIQAALNGEKDRLVGASANIAVGRDIKSGTGIVKLLMNPNSSFDNSININQSQPLLCNTDQTQFKGLNKDQFRRLLMDSWSIPLHQNNLNNKTSYQEQDKKWCDYSDDENE